MPKHIVINDLSGIESFLNQKPKIWFKNGIWKCVSLLGESLVSGAGKSPVFAYADWVVGCWPPYQRPIKRLGPTG